MTERLFDDGEKEMTRVKEEWYGFVGGANSVVVNWEAISSSPRTRRMAIKRFH